MLKLLRDIGLSYAPAEARSIYLPASTERLRIIALYTGALQSLGFLVWLLVRAVHFMAQVYARYSDVLPLDERRLLGAPFAIFFLSYLLYPKSLVLVYFIVEGVVRWMVAYLHEEVMPSGPVTIGWKAWNAIRGRRHARRLRETELPDYVEIFGGNERIHISCSRPRPHWNATITIAIRGENYEVEKAVPGEPPYACLYVLRRAPYNKVRRGFEEYEIRDAANSAPST